MKPEVGNTIMNGFDLFIDKKRPNCQKQLGSRNSQ